MAALVTFTHYCSKPRSKYARARREQLPWHGSFSQRAKEFEWDKAWEVLDEHPGYVDMRPPYRKFAAIHEAAFEGGVYVERMWWAFDHTGQI